MRKQYIFWFEEISKEDIGLVGGKGANLGEMIQASFPVPYGFVVSAKAYFDFLAAGNLRPKLEKQLKVLDYKDPKNLAEMAKIVQSMILKTPIPSLIAKEIMFAYLHLLPRAKRASRWHQKIPLLLKEPLVAVRSSATAEDLPQASFAGQQETYLNVRGEATLLKKIHQAWASLFTPRAIFYREEQKFPHLKVGLAVVVQLMVNSEVSGVMFTVDPVTNEKGRITIEAVLGLGEMMVQGQVDPDHYEVEKKTLKILTKKISFQNKKLVRKNGKNQILKIGKKEGGKQKLTDEQIQKLARLGVLLEKHYYFPQDVEWAVEKREIYLVQTRPVTTLGKESPKEKLQAEEKRPVILKGDPASPGLAWGPVRILFSPKEISRVSQGDVLVTVATNPDFVPAMKKAAAIVTERGGRTSHAAIVSRELGIPAVVGATSATKILKEDEVITVNGQKGEIYRGGLTGKQKFLSQKEKSEKNWEEVKTATKIYVNLASPQRAFEVGKMNFDGVGLLRAEFMIADIGIHPKKLLQEHREKIFINKLAADLEKFCRAFFPRPVVYRATDFKTNEYRNLKGGQEFEPEEPNPMLGYRGAFRYMSDPKVFFLELEAIKKVRHQLGFRNLWLMLPFVRTVRELVEVKKLIGQSGLFRSPTFKLWMMVEIPSNVILLEKFCEAGIDGVSIGSNDLTMLILGTDRDNTEVSPEFDERNEAVLWAIERVIKVCHRYKITSSICGQAPSDYPDLVEKLVSWGITSLSVNVDALARVREAVYEAEKKLVREKGGKKVYGKN